MNARGSVRVLVVWLGLTVSLVSCTETSSPNTNPTVSTPTPSSVPAIEFELGGPEALAFDADGDLYISEWGANRVDLIDTSGELTVVAGTGAPGYDGDGGPATEATLSGPTGLAFDDGGNLLIVDHNNGCVRSVDAVGVISDVVGRCAESGPLGDGGSALEATLADPIGIALDDDGNVYIADELNGLIRRVDPSGTIETIAGGGSLPPKKARDGVPAIDLALSHTSYVVVDQKRNVYFSDFDENVVMRIDPHGGVTRVAGTGTAGYSGDGGSAIEAELSFPTGLALDSKGNLYISDANNHRIRMVDRDGIIRTVAGTGEEGFSGDGRSATNAQLSAPAGLLFDAKGRLFIADQGNNVLRKVDRRGVITTIAGVTP